jgi:hypothetical protein
VRPTLTCVEGVGMHRHSARLMRVGGGALVAAVIAPWLGGAVANASTGDLVSGDDRATAVAGNIHDGESGNICSQLGFADDIEVGGDSGDAVDSDGITFTNDGTYLNAVAVPDGKVIDAVVVKAGDFYNLYGAEVFATLPVNGMHGPLVGGAKNVPAISHWAACIGDAPPEVVEPTGTVTGDCENATIDVTAGSDATTFVFNQDGTETQDPIAAGGSDHVVLPWSGDSTVSVAVLGGEGVLDSATRDSESCDLTTPGASNPNVAFSNSCTSGIAVVLSNMDATAPATFTVTSNGASKSVKVNADSIRRLHFPVAEDTTATVTVTAKGLSKTTHAFAKDCTQVLGEKTVKTPKTPQVKGEQAQLPFTGLPAGLATALGGVLLAVGGALTLAGRRRTARHAE